MKNAWATEFNPRYIVEIGRKGKGAMQSTPPNEIHYHYKLFFNFLKYFQTIYGDGKNNNTYSLITSVSTRIFIAFL